MMKLYYNLKTCFKKMDSNRGMTPESSDLYTQTSIQTETDRQRQREREGERERY